jgi:hypothetical protein
LLVADQTVNSFGGWASAIGLWGCAAYRFQCRAARRLGHHHLLGRPARPDPGQVAVAAGLIGMAIVTARAGGDVSRVT